jgi:hypothetical protein
MTTRQERIDAFTHQGVPPADQPLELLCEDHVGTYVIPFLCRWSSGAWHTVDGAAFGACFEGLGCRARASVDVRFRG